MQKSARYSGCGTPGSTHSSQTTHPGDSTYLENFDDEDRGTAKLFVQQTIDGFYGPSVTNLTVSELDNPNSASQDDDSVDMDFTSTPRKSRLNALQLHTPLQECVAASGENRRFVPHASHKMALPLRRVCGECLNAARLHHQRPETAWQQNMDRLWSVSTTCSTAEALWGHYACVHAVLGGLKLADPGITTEPRGLTTTQSRTADIFTTAAVPGRSAALDLCVASPNATAARGDATF